MLKKPHYFIVALIEAIFIKKCKVYQKICLKEEIYDLRDSPGVTLEIQNPSPKQKKPKPEVKSNLKSYT